MKTVSRQRRWQLRHIKEGLCIKCGRHAVTTPYCEYHRAMQNKYAISYRKRQKHNPRGANGN